MVSSNNDNNVNSKDEYLQDIKFGRMLCSPPPGEEVIISGISGSFPNASSMDEFKYHLWNKIDMITSEERRWLHTHPEIPKRHGVLNDLTKFDNGFFGVHQHFVRALNPASRIYMEKAIECIYDAGLNPTDLEGTKTGIFLGFCNNDTEAKWYFNDLYSGFGIIAGNEKSVTVNRISHFLKVKGVSVSMDTACNSGMCAVDQAFKSIRTGESDMAIVMGANLCTHPYHTLQFARLGVLAKDGYSRVFDEKGAGYTRSEAVVAMFLQKAKDSKRIYAQIVHAKSNSDGYKEQGITYPSGQDQRNLLEGVYRECGIDPTQLSYLEAHGTGTSVGDPEEMNSCAEFYLRNRKRPLLIGSVKSNLGHSEPTSGLCSIAKVLLAFETNIIAGNLHFETPRQSIPALHDGRMIVVTDKTPLPDNNGLVGVNSFGFGGSNTHVLLKWHQKVKKNMGKPMDDLPRLVFVSGRTEKAIHLLLDDIVNKFDYEQIGLIHNIFRKDVPSHLYKGYTIVSKNGEIARSLSFQSQTTKCSKCYIYFGGYTEELGTLGNDLLKLPVLNHFKNRLEEYLLKEKLSLQDVLKQNSASSKHQIYKTIIMYATVVEMFRILEIPTTIVVDTPFKEFANKYSENVMNLGDHLNLIFVTSKSKEYLTLNGDAKSDKVIIFFYEGASDIFKNIQKNSIVFNLSTSVLQCKYVKVVSMDYDLEFNGFLQALGRLYESGITAQVQKIYPKVEFPVSRGTPMISSLIGWAHNRVQYVEDFKVEERLEEFQKRAVNSYSITLDTAEWTFVGGHTIDGKDLFPATGYLFLVWQIVSDTSSIDVSQLRVKFQNCKFLKACTVPKTKPLRLELDVMYQQSSGRFEITEDNVPVVTGIASILEDSQQAYKTVNYGSQESNAKILNSRDIYKELRLRGYQYTGLFKGMKQFNLKSATGKIEWMDNWISFMDLMLQTKILMEDSRWLYVPTSIDQIIIDPIYHEECVNKLKEADQDVLLDVHVDMASQTVSSGGVQIQGLRATSIPRRKYTADPVLEKYEFIANKEVLDSEKAFRTFLQIVLENSTALSVKAVEVINDEDDEVLSSLLHSASEDQPSVQSDITILSSKKLDVDFHVEDGKLTALNEYDIVIASNLSRTPIESVAAAVDRGYVISRETMDYDPAVFNASGLVVYNVYSNGDQHLVLARKMVQPSKREKRVYLQVTEQDTELLWLTKLQNLVKTNLDVIIYAQNEPLNGILGLVNCVKREPGCEHVRMVFIMDGSTQFDPNSDLFQKQLDRGMAVNILKNNKWGTYRHLILGESDKIKTHHSYANTTVRGDLSSMKWIEGPLSYNSALKDGETLVKIHYSAVNFKDVMTASGRISADVITRDRREQECVQGFEFSGKTGSGRRVMGMVNQGALATLVKADDDLLWDVPKSWTLEEAATVPVVYATCLYALVEVGRIKPKSSILIHSGTGGIGQAAINLCLSMNCTVFTTVGTPEKREFIKKTYPQINDKNIGSSRDIRFQTQILKVTKGKGVDFVLNSLSEDKLFASIHCLAKNGMMLEIGRFDLANDNQMSLAFYQRGISYHGVMLDQLFSGSSDSKKMLKSLLQKYIDTGVVKPLPTNVFPQEEIEKAFRFMSTGKHMGKVLIRIREEDDDRNRTEFEAVPRFFCNPDKSYIICGGLGGFGLELADWLILRGARNLVLTSRKGITTGYQNYRISIWGTYGCKIAISTEDITTESGCGTLLRKANTLAPVEGIFNLAVVLQDALLENQTADMFKTSFGPKAVATAYLDRLSRKLCPDLKQFVIFSSVSCGRGNAGQTNYGMSNSVMERICEKRRNEGLPAVAIQWGAIGDVGLVAELQENHIELAIGGTLQQSIASCLQCLDLLLRQKEAAVVASMVVAEKRSSSKSDNVFDAITKILGIKDVKTVSQQSSLAELGMDSMNAVEIKQTLERDFGIFLTPAQIRNLSLARLKELEDSSTESPKSEEVAEDSNFLSQLGNDVNIDEINTPVIKLITKNNNEDTKRPKIIAMPGMEGNSRMLQKLASMMDAEVHCLQYGTSKSKYTVEEIAQELYKHVKPLLSNERPFHIVGHSLGCVLAIELVKLLEKNGYIGTLSCLDGSPTAIKEMMVDLVEHEPDTKVALTKLENHCIKVFLKIQMDQAELDQAMEKIGACADLEEKINLLKSMMKSMHHLTDAVRASYLRLEAVYLYNTEAKILESKISLFKPNVVTVKNLAHDYDLGRYSKQKVEVKEYDGNHITILENEKLANDLLDTIKSYEPMVNGK